MLDLKCFQFDMFFHSDEASKDLVWFSCRSLGGGLQVGHPGGESLGIGHVVVVRCCHELTRIKRLFARLLLEVHCSHPNTMG